MQFCRHRFPVSRFAQAKTTGNGMPALRETDTFDTFME
ncbi:hypothetical protein EC991775_5247, partial [Escherichia coli 99.1775]